MSRQIGHINSLCKDLGDTAISSPSVIASCNRKIEIEMKVGINEKISGGDKSNNSMFQVLKIYLS